MMQTYKYTQRGWDISEEEKAALAAAIISETPAGWQYAGCFNRRIDLPPAVHIWEATYRNGKEGRLRRTKKIVVLESTPG